MHSLLRIRMVGCYRTNEERLRSEPYRRPTGEIKKFLDHSVQILFERFPGSSIGAERGMSLQ
jgi:hypothetical protein